MDLDGNERASIGLRNNSLNVIQILLGELMHKKLAGRVRHAALDALFETLDHVGPQWSHHAKDLAAELITLSAAIAAQQKLVDALPKSFFAADRKSGADIDAKRQLRRLDLMKADEHAYSVYLTAINRLLSLDPADFDPGKFNIEDLVPRKSLGEPNSIHDLQSYVIGVSKEGLIAQDDGSLDWSRSFRHIDYLPALMSIRVRNNVQKSVGPAPVDFIAIPKSTVLSDGAIWLYRSPDRQALIFTRRNDQGRLEIHYTPVANLTEDTDGELHYDRAQWSSGFPFEIFEDPMLNIEGDRISWLDQWHTDEEWLKAVHRTRYSNGIIGITEALLRDPVADPYLQRKRELRGADMIVFASDHWNFNVRGFNPGGNHGSFLRVSTHSVLMFSGGDETGIPKNLRIADPYDSLSLVPTVLMLMGKPDSSLRGPVIHEIVEPLSLSQ